MDSKQLSEPLDFRLADFMALADGSDEEIIEFARQVGPLHWPAPPDYHAGRESATATADFVSSTSPRRTGPTDEVFAEPLWAWRSYARGLRALTSATTAVITGIGFDNEDFIWSFASIMGPLWLSDSAPTKSPLTQPDLDALAANFLLGAEPIENIVTAALDVAGVKVAYIRSPHQHANPAYTLSGTTHLLKRSDGSLLGEPVLVAESVLPILAVSLARSLSSQEPTLCAWCRKPAGIVKRRPRTGQRWYGDHRSCAMDARAQTQIRYEDKRALKRKNRKTGSEVSKDKGGES
jgi:hypothetical protein